MRRFSWCCVPLVAVFLACGSDDPPTGPAVVKVVSYDYSFDLETRRAGAELTLELIEAGDCVSLPVRAEGLEAVYFDGARMNSGELSDGVMTACGPGWDVGDQTLLRAEVLVPLETWGDSQVGYSISTDIEGQPFYYLVSWVGGCDQFTPCDTAPDVFATYRFRVAHPEGVKVLCPGTVTPGTTPDATTTTCEFSHGGGPTYSTFGIVASPSWETTELGDWGGVNVTLYDMPSTGIATDFKADQHRDFLAWMSDRFGPYPYGDELRFITGPTYWSGFEHPGNIVLYDRLNVVNSLYSDPLAHTTNHELVHMWAGDQTTLATTHDFVWKEAMAEYLTFVFDDENVSTDVARSTAALWKRGALAAEYYPVPAEQPALLDYYGDVYGAGPLLLFRQIEALFSREEVMAALAQLLGREHAIGVSDVKRALEDATGADLTGYFDAWIFGEGAPKPPSFRVDIAPTGNGTEVAVTVVQENPEAGLYGAAFAIELRTSDGSMRHDVWFDLGVDGAAEQTVTTDPGFAFDTHVFDPHRHTLAIEQLDTAQRVAPVRLNPWVPSEW